MAGLSRKLFGEDDEEVDSEELDKAQADGESGESHISLWPIPWLRHYPAEGIESLKKEAAAFREVRQSLGEEDGPRRVFEKASLAICPRTSLLTE